MRDNLGRFLKGNITRPKTSVEVFCLHCNKPFMVQPHRFKTGRGKFCSEECRRVGIFTDDVRKKMSAKKKGRPAKHLAGDKCHFWKGGVTPINKKIRMSLEYRLWRESVFKRDSYTCVLCKKVGHRLQADHIKKFSDYPELRFDINNGRTLCIGCHKKTDNYGRKQPIQ